MVIIGFVPVVAMAKHEIHKRKHSDINLLTYRNICTAPCRLLLTTRRRRDTRGEFTSPASSSLKCSTGNLSLDWNKSPAGVDITEEINDASFHLQFLNNEMRHLLWLFWYKSHFRLLLMKQTGHERIGNAFDVSLLLIETLDLPPTDWFPERWINVHCLSPLTQALCHLCI